MNNKQRHILLVDDDDKILHLLAKFLSKQGYSVSTALSANDAKKLMDHTVFDLIILDVMMAEVTGIEFAQDIKKLKNIPIILLTALGDESYKISGLAAGADDYVLKPFNAGELVLKIQNLIKLYESSVS